MTNEPAFNRLFQEVLLAHKAAVIRMTHDNSLYYASILRGHEHHVTAIGSGGTMEAALRQALFVLEERLLFEAKYKENFNGSRTSTAESSKE